MSRVAAAILAAGTSSRLGTPKQLLDLGGRPVLAHTLDAVKRAAVAPILVVLGHECERIRQSVDLSGTTIVENAEFASGQSASVRAAVRALPHDVDAVVFILGDQPLVDPAVIDALVRARHEQAAAIAQPRYAEGRGNPVLFGRGLFPELLELTGDVGARPILERHRQEIVVVDVSQCHRPEDIDTPEDFARLKDAYASRGAGEA